jgi:hypothetical protein
MAVAIVYSSLVLKCVSPPSDNRTMTTTTCSQMASSPASSTLRPHTFHAETALMTRLLFAILLCVLTSSQSPAQNNASQILLALSEDDRNAAFTHLLQSSSEKCDRVIPTLFNGAALGLENGKVLCRDRNSYSLSIPRR